MRPLLGLSSLILFTDLIATSNRKYLYVLSVAQPRRLICKQYNYASGLDIGLWQPLARGASESENPLAPQKHVMNQMIFAAGIYDFTREVAHFCTLCLYITKK